MVHIYSRILFSDKKEQTIHLCNWDRSQGKVNNQRLYTVAFNFHIILKMKKTCYSNGKQTTGCQRLEMGERNSVSIKE